MPLFNVLVGYSGKDNLTIEADNLDHAKKVADAMVEQSEWWEEKPEFLEIDVVDVEQLPEPDLSKWADGKVWRSDAAKQNIESSRTVQITDEGA